MTRRLPAQWAVNGALLGIAAATLFPLVWMLAVSFMKPGESSTYPPPLVPRDPTLSNYRELFAHAGMARYLLNSVLLAVAVTALSLAFNVAAGYAFAKLRFKGRERIFRVMLGALVIPSQVALVPLFLLLKQLGLVNTYAGVIVPAMASIFGIFLVRQYALAIPDDLLDAARIDGASEFRIFRSIVVPALQPIIVTLRLHTARHLERFHVAAHRAVRSAPVHVPVALASLSREHVADNELMMAGSVVTILPVLAVFIALQRYYLQASWPAASKM